MILPNNNKWLWFHMITAAIGAKIMLLWWHPQLVVLVVIAIALAWEILEFIKDDVEKIYGSKKRFSLDAIQDIAGAVIIAIIVVL